MNNNLYLKIKDYNYSPNIIIKDYYINKNITISNDIIKDILKHNFLDLINILETGQDIINIYIDNKLNLTLNKLIIIQAILEYLSINKFNNKNLSKFLNIASIYSYKNINTNNNHFLMIDNQEININVQDYFTFLDLDDVSYQDILNKETFNGISIKKFIYALINYFDTYKLLEKYIFPKSILKRIEELKSYQLVDYESLNQFLNTEDIFLKDISLNDDIITFLNKNKDNNLLKRIFKTYLDLCKLFTYDLSYYLNPLSDEGFKHTKIDYLKNINLENNKIVCFEFSSIFAYYLNSLNIPYHLINECDVCEYGVSHNCIIFRLNDYLIKVEPVFSIFDSDFTNTKVGNKLVGFTCINKNNKTVTKFNQELSEIYKSKNVDVDNVYLPKNKFIYPDIDISSKLQDFIQKIDLIIYKLNELELPIVDKYSYLSYLIKIVFNSYERDVNIYSCLIKNNQSISIILVYNEITYLNQDNKYLIYDGNNLEIVLKDELQDRFNTGEYEYLNQKRLPGIKEKSYSH